MTQVILIFVTSMIAWNGKISNCLGSLLSKLIPRMVQWRTQDNIYVLAVCNKPKLNWASGAHKTKFNLKWVSKLQQLFISNKNVEKKYESLREKEGIIKADWKEWRHDVKEKLERELL